MVPKNRDDELLQWMAGRLFPEKTPAQEAARIEKLLAAAPGTSFTDAEIARIVQKAHGELPLHAGDDLSEKNGIITIPKLRWPGRYLRRVPSRVAWAAAACVLLAAGWMLWQFLGSGGPGPERQAYAATKITFAGGQAGLLPIHPATLVAAVDLAKGHFRLDQGGVFLELEAQAGVEAEVQTPLGKVFAAETRCFIRCLERSAATNKDVLAVLVLHGQVRVQDKSESSYEIAEAGELIFLEAALVPKRFSPFTLTPEDQDWVVAQEILQLLASPDIQDDLELGPLQINQLTLTPPEDMTRAEDLLLALANLPETELRKKTGEFFKVQANRLLTVLDSSTAKKFEKLQIQQSGLVALVRKDVGQKLKLESAQQDKIRNYLTAFIASKQALFMHGVGSAIKLNNAFAELEQKQSDKVLAFLNTKQQKQWKELMAPPFNLPIGGSVPIDPKGFNLHMFSPQPKTEEQFWESWLFKAAKQVKMSSAQFSKATQMLQAAKKEAAAYRQDKQKDFSKLAAEKKSFKKNPKFDKQYHSAFETRADALHLGIAKIGQAWKDRVLDEVMTASQRKTLVQAAQKEMPQGLGVPGFWDKPFQKKGGPGFDKHH